MSTFDVYKKKECGTAHQSRSSLLRREAKKKDPYHDVHKFPGVGLLATMSSEYVSLLFARKVLSRKIVPLPSRDFQSERAHEHEVA